MLNLSRINFTYLIIQVMTSIKEPLFLDKVSFGLLPNTVQIPVPIPLKGWSKAGQTVSNLFDYVEVSAVKNLNVLTTTVNTLFSAQNLSNNQGNAYVSYTDNIDSKGNTITTGSAVLDTGQIVWANKDITYAERGEETLSLSIMGGFGNPITFLIDSYLEIASKTTWNVRFHYISNQMVEFGMILQSYSSNKSDNNPVMTFNFIKPERAKDQSQETISLSGVTKIERFF